MINNNVNGLLNVSNSLTSQRPASSANRAETSQANAINFDSLLSGRREQAQTTPRRTTQRDSSDAAHGENQPPIAAGTNAVQSQVTETAPAEPNHGESEATDVNLTDCEFDAAAAISLAELENAVLAELAAILGIEPAAFAELINALGLNLAELGEPHVQTELLLAIHGLDSDVELLSLPDALPMMQEMTAAVEQLIEVIPRHAAYAATALEVAEILEDAAFAELDAVTTEIENIAVTPTTGTETGDATSGEAYTAEAATPVAIENVPTTLPFNPNLTADVLAASITADVAATQTTQAPVDPQNIMDQIVNNMRFEVRGALSEIRIQLRPEHLGDVNLRISTQNGIVVAQFVAESQRVKEIIEAGFNQLRDALEEQGINISEIEVSVGQGDNERGFGFSASTGRNITNAAAGTDLEDGIEADNVSESIVEPGLEGSTIDYRT